MSETSPLSFFASKSIGGHLLCGTIAAALLALAVKLDETQPMLSISAGIGALIMLRGCPLCWTIGLIETARSRFK